MDPQTSSNHFERMFLLLQRIEERLNTVAERTAALDARMDVFEPTLSNINPLVQTHTRLTTQVRLLWLAAGAIISEVVFQWFP